MKLIPLILITAAILIVLLAAFSFRLFFDTDAKLPGGSCQSKNQGLKDKEIGCACSGEDVMNCENSNS